MSTDSNLFDAAKRPSWKSPDDVLLNPKDLRMDVYPGSGPGGQSINCTILPAVRITHLPSGFSAVCQDGRSQTENKNIALRDLKKKLFEAEQLRDKSTQSSE